MFTNKPKNNKNLKYWLNLSALCMAFWAASAPRATAQLKGQSIDKIIAKVDNYIVLKSDLEVAYLQASQNNQRPRPDLRCKVLENLVINKLMLAKADIDSVTVEEKMVNEQLDRRMQYMISTIGSREKLEAYYKKSVEQFKVELRKQVKEMMLAEKMQNSITADIKVTPAQVKRFFNEIPTDSLPFFSTEVEIGQIILTPKVGKDRKAEARTQLETLKNRIEKGEDFGTLARVYSQDPASAAEGGDLGFWGRGAMVPEYEQAALQLKPNELSGIVESQFGLHLIQLIEKRGTEYRSRHILIRPTSSAQDLEDARTRLDSIRTAIMQDSISFEKAAKKFSSDEGTKNNGGYFTDATTNSTHIATENLDPVIYFITDTMKVGQLTKPLPVRTEDGKEAVRMIYFKSKTPPHAANLKDDYQKIQHAALQEKKAEAMNKWFDKTKGEVFINIDPEYSECKILQGETTMLDE